MLGISIVDLGKLLFGADIYCYKELSIPKKSGGTRNISIPPVELKYIQRWILDNILYHMHISDHATGFANEKSILINVQKHLNKDCIVNLDIKDFFPTITLERVFMLFKYNGYTKEVSYSLAKLCTHNGVLPQGSPANPYITNVICLKLDKRLFGLAEKYEANYSHYADDITFSGAKGISKIISPASEIIADEGFAINEKKTRLAYHQCQEVTGLIVNEPQVKVPKNYKRKLVQEIFYCTKFGVVGHLSKTDDDHSFYKEHLYGKAYFIKMIEPDLGMALINQLNDIDWEC